FHVSSNQVFSRDTQTIWTEEPKCTRI
ncbi:hypothetical protein D030_3760B, partial [Vibrio parahaemolyticus AQ3810]